MATGLDEVIRNLNREVRGIEGRTRQGLLAAANFVEGESNEIVPHRLGALMGSSFAVVDPVMPIARVGYTEGYAPFVHEMPASFNYTKPGTGPKYLQRAISENQGQILDVIRNRARINGG